MAAWKSQRGDSLGYRGSEGRSRLVAYRNVKKDAFYFQFGEQEPPQPLLKRIDDIILIRHLAYFQLGEAPLYQAMCNLDRPADSLFLRAPLAKSAGGFQR